MTTENLDKLKSIKMSEKYTKMFEKLLEVSKEDPEELEMIISYVNSICSGSSVEYFEDSFMSRTISSLISKYHDNTLIDMNHDIKELQARIDELKEIKDLLTSDVKKLSSSKETLVNAIKELHEVTATKLSTLDTKPRYSVSWEKVNFNGNPIFGTCYKNIEEYVERLKYEYMEKMDVTYDDASKEFSFFAPFLKNIVDTVKTFHGNKSKDMLLYQALSYDDFSDGRQNDVELVIQWLNNTLLPTYTLIEEKKKLDEEPSSLTKKL